MSASIMIFLNPTFLLTLVLQGWDWSLLLFEGNSKIIIFEAWDNNTIDESNLI